MKSSISICVLVTLGLLQVAVGQYSDRRKETVSKRRQKPQDYDYYDEADGGKGGDTRLDVSSGCPEKNGFFADAEQCDKYYECLDGVAVPKLCADGFVFLEAGPNVEKCEFPFAVDCSSRPKLQEPKSSLNCPRKNGYFAHEDPTICDKFFFCVDGSFNAITCPSGLVFNNGTGTCTWPDQARKSNCGSQDLLEFECPKIGAAEPGQDVHPRYADPKDCQYFYVCIDGVVPRRSGCAFGTVYNAETQRCDKPKNVPDCKGWYEGQLDYDEDGEIVYEYPKPKKSKGTRRKGSRSLVEEDIQ